MRDRPVSSKSSSEKPLEKPFVAIADLKTEPFHHGTGYASRDAGISELLNLTHLGAVYTEVPPGKSACPFHVHRMEDEMFVILEGSGEYRFGDKAFQVKAGDVLGAPCGGRELAHKLTNTGDQMLRYLAISSKSASEICEYPDSNKILVRDTGAESGAQPFRFVASLNDERDYWDGEDDDDT